MRKAKTRRYFSLLEIIVCVFLLSLIATLFGYKAKDLFSVYSFRQDVKKVENIMHASRHFSTLYQADVYLVFGKTKEGMELTLYTDEPSLQGNELFKNSYRLTSILSAHFSGENEKEDQTTILFSKSNWIFPLKDLEITSKNKSTVQIHLTANLSQQNPK